MSKDTDTPTKTDCTKCKGWGVTCAPDHYPDCYPDPEHCWDFEEKMDNTERETP